MLRAVVNETQSIGKLKLLSLAIKNHTLLATSTLLRPSLFAIFKYLSANNIICSKDFISEPLLGGLLFM